MRTTLLLSGAFLLLPVAVQADELWIGNYFGDNIVRLDASNGSTLGTIGVGKLDGTLGMTARSDGVYVASELTGSIEKFNVNGTWLSRYATATTPTGITFDSAGRGYVAQFDADSVTRYSTTGTSLGTFVTAGSGGLNGPDLGITYGPDGNLYVPSFNSGDVLRYNGTTGAFIDKFIAAGSGGLSQPRQMIWRDGKVYVSSDNGNKVLRYNGTTGAFMDTFVAAGSGGLNGATGMVFHGSSLYVASWRNNRILKYDAATGAFQSIFASTGLNGPVSLVAVPEPATLAAVGGGLAMLCRRRRK